MPSIQMLYVHVESQALEAINWYVRDKRSKARWSRVLRFLTIILTAAGGLVPLLRVSGVKAVGAEWGYVLLALAAACVGLDRFFGFSSAWMRYLTTSMALQRLLLEFQMDWAIMNATLRDSPVTSGQCMELLQRIKVFGAAVLHEVENETLAWVAEFQSVLARIEQQAEKARQAESAQNRVALKDSLPAVPPRDQERVGIARPTPRLKASLRRLFRRSGGGREVRDL
jgi:hypothetical protein